jgi:hypothetical protein
MKADALARRAGAIALAAAALTCATRSNAQALDASNVVPTQVNMRASSLTFLYRVIVGREGPERAYESVARVWSPEGPWKSLITVQLRKAGIAFEPY